MGYCRQIIGTGVTCYLCMSMGLMFTWPSSTLKLFESTNTTLTRPMTSTELALFSSLSSVGAIVATPLAGFLLDKLGRKWPTILCSLTHVLAWTLITTFYQVEIVLLAVFISGIGGGVFLIVPVYVSEFCQESIRGAMTSCTMIFYAIGMLVSYLMGGYLEYKPMIYSGLTVSIIGVLMLSFLKESPTFLMQRGLEEEAKKSIAYYRSTKPSSKIVVEEVNAIRRALNPEMEDLMSDDEEKLSPKTVKPKEELSTMQFIRKSPSTRRALMVAIVVIMSSIFQGLVVVQVYAEPLFEEAVPTMSPTICAVVFAVLTIISGIVAAYLSDVAGRRPLMIYASAASGVSCLLLGSQLQFAWASHMFTAFCLYLFCFVFTLGPGTIPYVLAAELFLPEVKSVVTMWVIEVAWLSNFIILFIFNPIVELLGLGQVFYLFAAICFFTAIFCYFYQPETKGLQVDAIQELFTSKKKRKNVENGKM